MLGCRGWSAVAGAPPSCYGVPACSLGRSALALSSLVQGTRMPSSKTCPSLNIYCSAGICSATNLCEAVLSTWFVGWGRACQRFRGRGASSPSSPPTVSDEARAPLPVPCLPHVPPSELLLCFCTSQKRNNDE